MHCSASGLQHAGPAQAGAARALVALQRRPVCSPATKCSQATKKHITGRGQAPAASARPASSNDGPPPPASSTAAVPASMQARYEQAYSMSQLYAKERPPPIPLEEHERRRRVKDVQEVVDVSGPRRTVHASACVRVCLPLSVHRYRHVGTPSLAWICRYLFVCTGRRMWGVGARALARAHNTLPVGLRTESPGVLCAWYVSSVAAPAVERSASGLSVAHRPAA